LIAYLNDRLAKGEALTGESAVIAPNSDYDYIYRGKNAGKRFIRTHQIWHIIKKTFNPRFNWRLYVLRSYFGTQMFIAESKGKIPGRFAKFFMGHKGDIESVYTVNKCRLPEELLKEMRQAFKRSEEFLDLEVREEDALLKQKEILKDVIEKASPEKVQEILTSLGISNT
jgi:hypothetical protein